MKKIILLLIAVVVSLSASAQLEVITNSFRDYAAANKDAGGDNGMGHYNVTADIIDWPYDQDGNEGTLALLMVHFENMAPDDVRKVDVSASSNSYIVSKDFSIIGGRPTLKVFLQAGKNIDLTFTNQLGESTRLNSHNFTEKHVYEVGIRNKSRQPVTISTIPNGATVTFDGIRQNGVTPLTIPNVSLGDHTIAISPANPQIANPVDQQTITVTASNSAFHYDMHKTKNVYITATPFDSYIQVFFNDQLVAEGSGTVKLEKVPYDRSYLLVGSKGTDKVEDKLFIDANTPTSYILHVVGASSVSFTAKQNNAEVNGAEIVINGKPEGYTPLTKLLPYDTYMVQASYNGYTTSKKVKVNKGTKDVMLRIPNKKSTGFNPFDVDYRRRAWGIAVNYISRYYNYKSKGKTKKKNFLGDNGSSTGAQVGIVYQPYFGAGQGLSTGLFYQRTFGGTDKIGTTGGYYSDSEEYDFYENALYVPFQYQFRLPLHRNTSIAINAGVALTYGLGHKFTLGEGDSKQTYDVGYEQNDEFDTKCPEKLDYSLLLGAAFQWKALQFEVKYSLGLKDHSKNLTNFDGSNDKFSYKSSFVSAGLSLLF